MGIGQWQAGRRCSQSGNSGAEWVLLVALLRGGKKSQDLDPEGQKDLGNLAYTQDTF